MSRIFRKESTWVHVYIYTCTHVYVCIYDYMYVYKYICTHICIDSFLEILLTFPSTDNSQHSNYWPGNNNKIQKQRQENLIFLLGYTSGNILLVLSCDCTAVVQLLKCEQKWCGSGPETLACICLVCATNQLHAKSTSSNQKAYGCQNPYSEKGRSPACPWRSGAPS